MQLNLLGRVDVPQKGGLVLEFYHLPQQRCGGGGGGGGGGAIEGNQGRPSVLKAVPSAPPTVHLLNVQRHSQVDFVVSLCCLTLFAPPPAHKEGDQPLHWRVYSLGAVCQRQVDHQDAEVLVADDDAPADGGAHRRVVAQHCPHQQHRIYGQVDGKENRHQGAADPEKDGHHHVAEGEGVEDEDEDVDVEEEKLADEVVQSWRQCGMRRPAHWTYISKIM
ncbi:hypothetical protein TYRP_022966 [Tyrophagus putrescentiae]|nr:hypothetical protein TYRP_022966 [Tyrophagus putrescentiae]